MLRIKALGSLTVVGPDGPIVNAAAQPKRLALLAVLARAGERGITRDKALWLFWPDAEEERARRSLANALWAMRRDLGSDEVFLPGNDLRLNAELVTSDVGEFDAALARSDLARAATLYEGPFLDGFRLAGAPEFDRWVDAERTAISHQYMAAAEKLARSAEAKGDAEGAVEWWRKITAQDPLNSRLALGLMRALVAAGDRVGAVRHAQIYEALIDQELDLPPDRKVVEFANELREALGAVPAVRSERETPDQPAWPPNGPAEVGRAALASSSGAQALVETPTAVSSQAAEPILTGNPGTVTEAEGTSPTSSSLVSRFTGPSPRRRSLTTRVGAGVVAVVVVVGAAVFAIRGRMRPSDAPPIIALGQIADYRKDQSTAMVKPLTDMLATALARSPALQVVSTARMYELGSRLAPANGDATSDSYVRAARAAGATELLEGSLYALDDGSLRLDVRCVDIVTGNVRSAHSVVAANPFALADSATARLIAEVGGAVPSGSVADVTTRSLAAYRFYDEGVRAFYQEDLVSAERLLEAALAEDSTFALAAYYLALSYRQDDAAKSYPMLERAVRLSERTSDRERLCIRASWEEHTSSPALRATAESLLVRYPQEVEGYFFTGIVRVTDGDFLGAVPFLERAIAMDSLSLGGNRAECTACEAFRWLMVAYTYADSLARADRDVQRWRKLQPRSGLMYASLVDVLFRQGRLDEAIAAWRERSRLAPGYQAGEDVIARLDLVAGKYAEADELMRAAVATGTGARRAEAYSYLSLSSRYQGRPSEAVRYAREEYRASREARPNITPPNGGPTMAQALRDMGRGREAAAVFEAVARWTPSGMPAPDVAPGMTARRRAWNLTHAADALASTGDTATLAARADSVEYYGARTLYRHHRELHHHVRGLLLAARHRDEEAIAEFRQALVSPASGYTRTNYELGRALLRRGRPAEAAAVIQPALRSGVEAGSFYVTQVELRELLAQAWDSLGSSAGAKLPARVTRAAALDSAAVHYRWVARSWNRGDPPFAERAARADARARALEALGAGGG